MRLGYGNKRCRRNCGKKNFSSKLNGESVKLNPEIDECRTDKFGYKIENSKLSRNEEYPHHCENILEVKLKSIEIIETEIDNCLKNTNNLATALIVGSVTLSAYFISNFDKFNHFSSPVVFLSIPILVCIISAYLTDHLRTLIYNTAHVKQLEEDINKLFPRTNNVIYFEHVSFPLYSSTDPLQHIIQLFSAVLYFVPLIIFIIASKANFQIIQHINVIILIIIGLIITIPIIIIKIIKPLLDKQRYFRSETYLVLELFIFTVFLGIIVYKNSHIYINIPFILIGALLGALLITYVSIICFLGMYTIKKFSDSMEKHIKSFGKNILENDNYDLFLNDDPYGFKLFMLYISSNALLVYNIFLIILLSRSNLIMS